MRQLVWDVVEVVLVRSEHGQWCRERQALEAKLAEQVPETRVFLMLAKTCLMFALCREE
jgi:hypothetical protein